MSEAAAEKPVSETRVRVRYAETDQMGVVYHANYLIWFEVGRVEFIRQLGLDYKSMEQEDGCGIAVVQVDARYRAPARYDDELVIETRLLAARGAVIRFGYQDPAGGGWRAAVRGRDGACGGGEGHEEAAPSTEICGTFCRVAHLISIADQQIWRTR